MYTIWVGEYSDADVIGVAEDRRIADAFAKVHHGHVEEAPLITDENFIVRAEEMRLKTVVCYQIAGDLSWSRSHYISEKWVEPSEDKEYEEIGNTCDKYYYVRFYLDGDYDEKKANDKFIKYLAEKRGL